MMKDPLTQIANAEARSSRARDSARGGRSSASRFVVVLSCLAFISLASTARAQAGRVRPEPQPSPTPGAQQRPRRVVRDADDSPPGEPSSPTAPSRVGPAPQTQPGAQQKQGAKPAAGETIDDDEVLNVESNLVPVSASVTDALGHAITDLKLEDFELRVDGQPKPISDISHAETPVRLALLFDNSSSIRPTRELEKQAAINFFRRVIRPVDQASIFSISTFPSLDQPLTGDVPKLVHTIERYTEAEGSTSLFDTIAMAADYLRPQPGRKVMIIVSDGVETTSNLEDFGEMVRRVLASDCQVFVIQTGLSQNANLRDLTAERRMQDLTSYTGGFVFVPKQPSDLEVAFTQIAADLAQQYVLSYYPSDDGRDGRFRAISVRVKTRTGVNVRARRGYYPRRRDNLSANAPGPQTSELASSAPDFIRDPAAPTTPPAQARQPATAQRRAASNINAGARTTSATNADANLNVGRAADPNASAPAASNTPRHGSKNLDPDADEESSGASAQAPARQTVKLGTFVPAQDAGADQTAQAADASPPPKRAETAAADPKSQPTPQSNPQSNPQPTTQSTTQASQPQAARLNPPASEDATTPTAQPSASPSNAQSDAQPQPATQTQSQQTQSQPTPSQQTQSQPMRSQQVQSPQSPQSQQTPPRDAASSRPAGSGATDGASEATKKPLVVSGGVLNARARTLPVPSYPETARRMSVAGTVVVEVTIDEGGKVIEARATSGPVLLRDAAVSAARHATFPPATVEGQPAQLKGVINYTFKF